MPTPLGQLPHPTQIFLVLRPREEDIFFRLSSHALSDNGHGPFRACTQVSKWVISLFRSAAVHGVPFAVSWFLSSALDPGRKKFRNPGLRKLVNHALFLMKSSPSYNVLGGVGC